MHAFLNQLKNPRILFLFASGFLAIMGALTGWVDYQRVFDESLADRTLQDHQFTVVMLLLVSMALFSIALYFRQFWLNLVVFTFCITAVMIAFNHIPGQDQATVFEPTILFGLPLTLLGAITFGIGSFMHYVKKLDARGAESKK